MDSVQFKGRFLTFSFFMVSELVIQEAGGRSRHALELMDVYTKSNVFAPQVFKTRLNQKKGLSDAEGIWMPVYVLEKQQGLP